MQGHPYRAVAFIGGFTLLEVLVALFVLAAGVVGAGAAQLAAQRTRQQSALASEAAQLGASLAARMQVNAPLTTLPDAANPYLLLDYDARADGPPGPPAVSCFGAAACSPAQLAQFDLHQARQAVHDAFPGGRIAVCRDGEPWDAAARRYRWACAGNAGAPVVIKLGWIGAGEGPGQVTMVAR